MFPWAGWVDRFGLGSPLRNWLLDICHGKFMAEELSSGQERTPAQTRRRHERSVRHCA